MAELMTAAVEPKKARPWTYPAVVSAVILAGGYLFIQYKKDRRAEAQELFQQAQNMLNMTVPVEGGASPLIQAEQQLGRITSDFKDLGMSRPAALYEAEIMRERGQVLQALERVRRFLQDNTGKKADVWTALARRNEAYYLEQAGRFPEALQSYMTLAEAQLPWISPDELALGQARCLLASGDSQGAQTLLVALAEKSPSSYWARTAAALLKQSIMSRIKV